ncbi:MAG TPA: Ig-like domain-containing protein, partial [Xanthobacteraceae bacterium]|nr:Ig-like domain-containing protein [Xanthobacteraceae bacterium]
ASLNALAAGESTTDTFSYTIGDGHGGSASATVTVTVDGVNDAPTAQDDTASTNEDDLLVVTGPGVLANDSDPEGDTLTVTGVNGGSGNVGTPITLLSGATLTMQADGGYTYNADTITGIENQPFGSTVTDSFTYTVSDGHGGTDQATVNITVNVPPEEVDAKDDKASITVDGNNNNKHGHKHDHCDKHDHDHDNNGGNGNGTTTLVVSAANGVLANDTAGDPDDPLHVSAVNGMTDKIGQPITLDTGATLTLFADGSYIYDPSTITFLKDIKTGTFHDTFSYTVTDGHGDTSTANVDITVNVDNNNNNNDHDHDDHHHQHHHHHHHHNDWYIANWWSHNNHHDGHDNHHNGWDNKGGMGNWFVSAPWQQDVFNEHDSHQNSGSNNNSHDLNQGSHGWSGEAAIAMAQLEHAAQHNNHHFH